MHAGIELDEFARHGVCAIDEPEYGFSDVLSRAGTRKWRALLVTGF